MIIKYELENDDLAVVYMNCQYVGDVDYITYGRNGMAAVKEMLKRIAFLNGGLFKEVEQ